MMTINTCKWKDRDGHALDQGAVVMWEDERTGSLYLGKVVRNGRSGHYMVRRELYFDRSTMQFEALPCGGVNEGRDVALAPRKTKFFWRRHGYQVENVRLVKAAPPRPWRPGLGFDAPAPILW